MKPDIGELCAAGEVAFANDEFEEAEAWYELACTGQYVDPHPSRSTQHDHLIERRFARWDELLRRRYGGVALEYPAPVYTEDHFKTSVDLWKRVVVPVLCRRSEVHFLEVGSKEGSSAVWIMQNICIRPGDHLTCVDPFYSNYEHRWDSNLAPFRGRVTKVKALSYIGLRTQVRVESDVFDAIYIDGSHFMQDVLKDLVLCWDLLQIGGLLILDDYGYGGSDPKDAPAPAIDAFLRVFEGDCTILHKGYQVILTRTR